LRDSLALVLLVWAAAGAVITKSAAEAASAWVTRYIFAPVN
jgi:hypothetical protein